MFKSACDTMKKSILLSAILIASGSALEVLALFLSFESMVPALFIYGGFAAISLGIVLMLLTLVATLLPGVNERLSSCQH